MPFSRCFTAVGTMGLVLAAYAGGAAAHGVGVTADVDGATATLELTDETGEVCVAIDPAPQATAVAAVVDDDTGEVVLILGEGFGATPSCQFFDAAIVNDLLADVDAHRFVIAFGNTESSGVLSKPELADSETAATENQVDDGPNVPLIFGVGASLGVAGVILRKRFQS